MTRIYESAVLVPVFDEEQRLIGTAYEVQLRQDVMAQLAKWCAKQTLAAWYVQMGRAVSSKAAINIELLTNAPPPQKDLEKMIQQMGQDITLTQGKVSKIHEFSYRFSPHPKKQAAVMFAQYHGGLAFLGVVNDNPTAKLSKLRLRYRFGVNAHRGLHTLQ